MDVCECGAVEALENILLDVKQMQAFGAISKDVSQRTPFRKAADIVAEELKARQATYQTRKREKG